MKWCSCLKIFKLIKSRSVIPEKPCEINPDIEHDSSKDNVTINLNIDESSYRRRSKIINILGSSITVGISKPINRNNSIIKIRRVSDTQ
ncbi:hypothetical protein SteCoe_31226 [Stentor coeruleus]|uniref:Uncharacterized protein n=1 Tax=Stentor coeruleus TaxID=5963 RepID=A0A1R2B1V2_9CILI|nr:hypothetical protein SteCoe_31226 [Stentor coeruleus]